jgi:hypothetical protein
MKNIISFLGGIGLIISPVLFAQTPRKVLLEHFTQASCGPCAQLNPGLQTLLDANPEVVYIKYQVSWPGTDPMYLHNTGNVNQRVNFYNVSSVPQSVFEGNVYQGSPSGLSQSNINMRSTVPAQFELQVQSHLNDAKDSIFATITLKKTEDLDNTAVYTRVAVIEKHIQFTTPPGNNGEKDFYHVMKKLLPYPLGTAVTSSLAVGETQTFDVSWKLQNVYDVNELTVLAFIQNQNTKDVYQAAYSTNAVASSDKDISASIAAVQVFPNPAKENVSLVFNTDISKYDVYNSNGQLKFSGNPEELKINTHAWPAGLYWIIAQDKKGNALPSVKLLLHP